MTADRSNPEAGLRRSHGKRLTPRRVVAADPAPVKWSAVMFRKTEDGTSPVFWSGLEPLERVGLGHDRSLPSPCPGSSQVLLTRPYFPMCRAETAFIEWTFDVS